jgi:hypothetical protein
MIIPESPPVPHRVNEASSDIEDARRNCAKAGTFGDRLVELTRSVYINNEHGALIKKDRQTGAIL